MPVIPADRQRQIIEIINRDTVVNVNELSALFQVSELTIRRDLDALAKRGLVERTHGGALQRRVLPVEPAYSEKSQKQREQKISIAKRAVEFIEDGDTVFINSGSTTFEVIRALKGKRITIVTNNIDAVRVVDESSQFSLILLGGVYRMRSHSVSGGMSEPVLSQVYANKAVIGVDGCSISEGLTTPIIEEAQTTRQMIERTVGPVIVVAAGNKIGVVSNYVTVGIDEIDVLITDESGRKMLSPKDFVQRKIELVIA
ncbi:MAG: DeoR/GlpR family DNA-binding transcription regulator [Sphaerochaetaceae bacterium]|nr:DeoR/GlpR family DNA-binding transcription regulator [Sphaerochaetaceae bacterium]